jgi:hypothetical protein
MKSIFVFLIIAILAGLNHSVTPNKGKKGGVLDDGEYLRLRSLDNLLLHYKNKHGLQSLKKMSSRELCSKQFILSPFSCRDAGNNIGTFLDNLVFAIILDRTIVAYWNKNTNFCFGSVKLKDWIVNTTSLTALQHDAGCCECLLMNVNASKQTYMHEYIHIYIHIYIYTYVWIYVFILEVFFFIYMYLY